MQYCKVAECANVSTNNTRNVCVAHKYTPCGYCGYKGQKITKEEGYKYCDGCEKYGLTV